jgi:hypothetical protein
LELQLPRLRLGTPASNQTDYPWKTVMLEALISVPRRPSIDTFSFGTAIMAPNAVRAAAVIINWRIALFL